MADRKKWLSPKEQVAHLKSKGVRFSLMSEDDATVYLEKNNNYFRLRSYRTGFSKVEEGGRAGEYANLDFKMLVDLSIIDMLLRYEMLPLTLDIEHFAKVRLLTKIEKNGEDGYDAVANFIKSYDRANKAGAIENRIKNDIKQGESSPYIRDLVAKYPNFDYPAWAFIEVISFGTFNYFYKFCGKRFGDKDMINEFYLLQSVKSLRNACAHNNCIINDLKAGEPQRKASFLVSQALGSVPGIGSSQRKAKLSNERIQQIVTTFYLHRQLASSGVLKHRAKSLERFSERMNQNLDFYTGNLQIKTGFEFLSKIIEAWFPIETFVERNAQSIDGTTG